MSTMRAIKNAIKLPYELFASATGYHRRTLKYPALWVIMYHRILPQNDSRYSTEEPGMIVEPETFSQHLRIFKNEFSMIPLIEWVNRVNRGLPVPSKSCAITFDDGWLDNYEYALPILETEQVPATFFVVSELAGTNNNFWPNRLIRLLQQPQTIIRQHPWLLSLVGNHQVNRESIAKIISCIKSKPDSFILDRLEQAEKIIKLKHLKPVLMGWDQLRHLSDHPLFDIGSHSCNHVRLCDGLDPSVMKHEISTSKKQLTERLEKPVRLFCYPNGEYSKEAVSEVANLYEAAVTTQPGINLSTNSSLHTLNRYGIHQGNADNRRKLLANISR